MNYESLFGLIETANSRPELFSAYTSRVLWADEHTSARMLGHHLDGTADLASRRNSFIDKSVKWMVDYFRLSADTRVIDFGCGPGLYTSRFASAGADVTGVDFSPRSIDYARAFASEHRLDVTYIESDYLDVQPHGQFDLITMIMCDFCALSPVQRSILIAKFREHLAPQGRVLLDVYSLASFAEKTEKFGCEKRQAHGLWSKDPYYAFISTFKYEQAKVSLDKYTIVEENRIREVYNWLQHYSPEMLQEEANELGLEIDEVFGSVAGGEYKDSEPEFAVTLKMRGQ